VEKKFNYSNYTRLFTVLNVLFVLPLFFSYIYHPGIVGFQALEFSWEGDPREVAFTLFLVFCITLTGLFSALKRVKLAFYASLFPIGLFLTTMLIGLLMQLVSSF